MSYDDNTPGNLRALAPGMTSYAGSTQRRDWTFTESSLSARRAAALEAAVRCPSGGVAAPTAAEALLLQRYYTLKAKELATALQLPGKVYRCCSLLLARTLLDPTALAQLDARTAMLASLYVAAMAEERYVSAEALAASVGGGGGGGGVSSATLLSAEVLLLRATGFSLVTHQPHRAVLGFLVAARERGEAPAGGAGAEELRGRAYARCDALLLTDAPLLHSPGALGLAALQHAARGGPWQASVEAVAAGVQATHGAAPLLDAADALTAALAQPPPDEEAVRAADRSWKTWRHGAKAAAADAVPVPSKSPQPSPKRRKSVQDTPMLSQ